MTLDLVALRESLRSATGTDDSDMDNDKADRYLNRAYWELLDKFHFREKEVTAAFQTVAGTRFYNMPSPFEALKKLIITDPDTTRDIVLQRISPERYESLYGSDENLQGMPQAYYREGCSARIWPTPDKVYDMLVKYWTTLEDLSDSNTTPEIPQSWHEIILFGGQWRAFMDLGDVQRGYAFKRIYNDLISTSVPVESKEEIDSSRAGVQPLRNDEDYRNYYSGKNTKNAFEVE